MPASLDPIFKDTPITEGSGVPTVLFLLRWQQLSDSFIRTPTIARPAIADQSDALPTTTLYTVLVGGLFRVGYAARKLVVDGVASSLQVTLGWTDRGVPVTRTFAALVTDDVTATDSNVIEIPADADSDITISVAYASTTPNRMTYSLAPTVEALA